MCRASRAADKPTETGSLLSNISISVDSVPELTFITWTSLIALQTCVNTDRRPLCYHLFFSQRFSDMKIAKVKGRVFMPVMQRCLHKVHDFVKSLPTKATYKTGV